MSQPLHLQQAIEHVLESATQRGAEADVITSTSESFSLKANKGQLDEYKVSSGQVIGVRVIKDQRVATSYSESLLQSSLDTMLDNALISAKYAKVDEHQRIQCHKSEIHADIPEIFQEDTTSVDAKIDLALSLEQNITAKPNVSSSPYNGYADSTRKVIVANTLGSFCEQQERSFSCYAYALYEAEGKNAMHGGVSIARRFDQLNPTHCIEHAFTTARDLLDGAPVATGNYSAIFTANALASLFSAFGLCFSGVGAMKGINPWRDKIDTQLANAQLTLTDKVYVEGGMHISAFDSEGYPTQDTVLIENGHLRSFLHNSHTASYFGIENTANAARSAKSSLEVSANHKVIDTGSASLSEVGAGEYLELVELQGVHAGADAISGDFSFGASGFLCRDGVRVQAVRGITVAGNFYQMLAEIDAIGDTLEHNDSKNLFAPKIRFSRLNIAGK